MVVNRPEDFLRRYQQAAHFPDRHLEIHLGEFEDPDCESERRLAFFASLYISVSVSLSFCVCVNPANSTQQIACPISTVPNLSYLLVEMYAPLEEPRHSYPVRSTRRRCRRRRRGAETRTSMLAREGDVWVH